MQLVTPGECVPSECKFNHDRETSNLRRKGKPIKRKGRSIQQPPCYRELQEEKSCPYKDECRFNHDFPDTLRMDTKQAQEVCKEIEKKIATCVNEYMGIGKCRKGKECKFNHNISEEQRNDPQMQETIQKKLESMRMENKSQSANPLSVNKDARVEKLVEDMTKLQNALALIQNCP